MQKLKNTPSRGPVFWVALGALTGLLAWRLAGPALTACRPHAPISSVTVRPGAPTGFTYHDLPGVDLGGLTQRQRFTLLHRAAIERCTCGCKESIAQCRHDDPTCRKSLALALKLRDEVKAGTMEPGH